MQDVLIIICEIGGIGAKERDPASTKNSLHPDAKWCNRKYDSKDPRESDHNALASSTKGRILGQSIVDGCIFDKSFAVKCNKA